MAIASEDDGAFDPVCRRPAGLVHAVRAGRSAFDGLTWRVANGPHYERVGKGLYVPRDRPGVVEQRVVDAACRLPVDGSRGFVTG
ncbi:hypothetical protein GCM10023340_35020 [Nocardioides marinquilinus]|uniref:Uncharacterized protein n=1 Tax=Nocardioides marinquilinus TaxID=1210400 RepID=A0ABP9PWF2_9ACTN